MEKWRWMGDANKWKSGKYIVGKKKNTEQKVNKKKRKMINNSTYIWGEGEVEREGG